MTAAADPPASAAVGDRTLVRAGRAIAGVSVLVMLVAIVVYFASGEESRMVDEGNGPFIAITFFAAGVFALGLPRVPRNGALWALGLSALLSSINELASAVAVAVAGIYPSELVEGLSPVVDTETGGLIDLAPADLDVAAALALNLGQWLWVFLTFGLFVFFVLLFPDGRLPSARWRWVVRLVVAGAVLTAIQTAWIFRPVATESYEVLQSRIGSTSGSIWDDLMGVWFVMAAVGMAAAIVGMVLKWRRSKGEERLQFRWVGFAMIVLIVTNFLSLFGVHSPLIGAVTGVFFVVALGVAITKYRLYDIDLVISRTLVYGALALFIGAVYVGVVVITGSTVASGDSPNAVVTIAATALIAAAFQPLRRRLERLASRLVYGKKATPYEVLSEFSQRVAATDEGLVDEVVESLVGGTGAETAAIWVADRGRWHRTAVFPADTPSTVSPKPNADPSNDKVVVPVEHDGETLGLVVLDSPSGQRLSDEDRTLATQVASGMGLALHNQQLTDTLRRRVDELRDSRRRIVAVQDETRRTLERNLHDGAQQQLVALKVKLGLAKRMALADHAPQTEEMLEELSTESDAAIEAMRSFARGIYPPLLEAEGLEAALQAQARRVLVPVELSVDGIGRYDRDTEATVYFCVLEALRNASKHAAAAAVEVSLAQFNGRVRFDVVDDGVGFDPDQAFAQGSGLTHMADRLDALGGELTIHSAPGEATRLEGQLPAVPAGRIGVSA